LILTVVDVEAVLVAGVLVPVLVGAGTRIAATRRPGVGLVGSNVTVPPLK